MKKEILIFIAFALLFIVQNLYPQGYYYEGRFIQLNPRTDGFAVLSKSGSIEFTKNRLNEMLSGDNVKIKDEQNLFYIKINGDNFNQKNSLKNKISNLSDNIKFVTDVYFGESKSVTQIPTDEFIVQLNNENDFNRLDLLNLSNNVIIKGKVDAGRAYVLKTTDNSTLNALQLCEIYFNTGIFKYAEPNFTYPAEGFFNWTPNDVFYPIQWPLNNTGQTVNTGGYSAYGDSIKSSGIYDADMDIDLAWDYVKGNQNVIVAVFDTGVDSLHPDLKDNLAVGYNAFSNNNKNDTDPGSHGTCTIGIIGARSNNGTGISGIAGGDNGSNHCKVCSYRLVDNTGAFTSDANIARAFDTARVRGVHVSSNSWGGGTPSATLTNAINNLAVNGRGGLGCVILFSSGNNGSNPPEYPSYLGSVVCVGASTNIDSKKSPGTGDQFWWGGNFGEDSNGDLDLVAPTISITTDIRGNKGYTNTDYDSTFNGTSCSCPNAAGVAALIFSVNPSFTRNQVIDNLYRGCDKIDNIPYSDVKAYGKWSPYTGYGRVNAYNSVRLAAGVDITPPTINHTNSGVSSSTYPFVVTAEIIDQDGSAIPVSGANAPKIYYRKNKNNSGWTTFTPVDASSNTGNTFYFRIPCSGWQTEIEYYISTKDNSGNEALFPKNSASYPCYTAVGTTVTETGKFAAFTLPSSGVAISGNLNMGNYKILSTDIKLYLRHSWLSDFNFSLWSPNSDTKRNRVCLFSRNGGNGDNITGATLSDAGTNFWRELTPPYNNASVKPDYYFSTFNGTSSGGNWRLLYYDAVAGDGGTFDSARLNIKRLSGTTSPCARLDFVKDSVAFFFDAPLLKDTVDFYLKSVGTEALVISSYSITGLYASNFSIINSPPLSISVNDSGLFRITYNNAVDFKKTGGITDEYENALLNINCNDPSKPVFSVSLQSDSPLPVTLTSFSSNVIVRDVRLNWVTEKEVNNKGFEVQKKENRKQNTGTYETIGFVESKGNVNSATTYSYFDRNLTSGSYKYRLKQIDYNGNYEYFELNGDVIVGIPNKFDLSQNYPNPFNPVTKINFDLPEDGKVNLRIYDMLGREVATLVNDMRTAGYYTVNFDASKLSSGIYLYRLSAGNYNAVKKMAVIK